MSRQIPATPRPGKPAVSGRVLTTSAAPVAQIAQPLGLYMQGLVNAKWSYVTRRVSERENATLGGFVRQPRLGDLVVTKVTSVGEHDCLEDVHGRRARLYPGDIVVGACGNRYATDFYEGYLPAAPPRHTCSPRAE